MTSMSRVSSRVVRSCQASATGGSFGARRMLATALRGRANLPKLAVSTWAPLSLTPRPLTNRCEPSVSATSKRRGSPPLAVGLTESARMSSTSASGTLAVLPPAVSVAESDESSVSTPVCRWPESVVSSNCNPVEAGSAAPLSAVAIKSTDGASEIISEHSLECLFSLVRAGRLGQLLEIFFHGPAVIRGELAIEPAFGLGGRLGRQTAPRARSLLRIRVDVAGSGRPLQHRIFGRPVRLIAVVLLLLGLRLLLVELRLLLFDDLVERFDDFILDFLHPLPAAAQVQTPLRILHFSRNAGQRLIVERGELVLHQGGDLEIRLGHAFGLVQQLVERRHPVFLAQQLMLADGSIEETRCRIDDFRRIDL